MSDIKIIKVANTGGAKVDSSGFFMKPKQPEPSQLSQFIQKENEKDKIDYEDEEDKSSVDSMTVSDVSSATQNSEDEEYTNESMTPAPLSPPTPRISSIVKDDTLNSYLEKPKVESQSPQPQNISTLSPVAPIAPVAPVQNNNTPIPVPVNEQGNNNAQSTTAQPANNRNDYYSDTEEDVIDMTDNKLYEVLASVLEDEDGENVSENMAKMNRNLEKVITMFEAYQQNNTKDEYLSKINEAIENQNKILAQIVKVLEKQPTQELNVAVLNENKENYLNKENNELNENNNNKNKKKEKPKSSSESSSSESDKGENTDDTEKNPDIKKIKVSDSIKHSTSTLKKDTPLKHRIQIKRKT